MTERCAVPGCRGEAEIVYLDHGICESHWNELTADDVPPETLRMVLGVNDGRPALESEMTDAKKNETPSKTTKKAAKPAKAGKAPKAKKETGPKPERVFAIRITDAELDGIHKASGPRNATRFIRQVAAAFVAEDEGRFREILKEAKEARA